MSILKTKLYIPPPRSKVVLRRRLIDTLNNGLHHRLTLISAPAGFGKTTLISEWIAGCDRPVAWLSLDEADSDPTRFLVYLIAALQTIAAETGAMVLDALESSQPPPIESILTTLLNEISTISDNFTLVLDDYHLIDAKPIDDALTFLLEHLPPQMHLVITTREDPNLPLARFRVRDQLTELRVTDLRFTPSEAAEFLNQVMGLNISTQDVAKLDTRTEGWIAGLQLAALSMQSHHDVHGFIQAFAGDHQYIMDYLVEEVLQRQPEPIRNFLLQTCILDRLNGPLCDAVSRQPGSKEQLETLRRGNFFLIPLDDKRHWYRYHHLFADVLYMHLLMEQPDQVPALHKRASEWYEQNGSPEDAIQHALAGKDFERAADLVELAVPSMLRARQEPTLLAWLQKLPDEQFHQRPVLSVHYAGTLLYVGEFKDVDARLRDAERWLDTITGRGERPAEMVVVNEAEFVRLPGAIAMYRAGLALAMGNIPDTITCAKRVLDLAPADDDVLHGAAAAMLGIAYWTAGNLDAAYRSYADGMAHLQRAGHISDAIGGGVVLADIRIAQGRLHDAMRIYVQRLQLAAEHGTPIMRGTADMYVGISELEREWNNPSAATQHLMKSKEQGEHTGFPQYPYRWRVAMARIQEAQRNFDDALQLLDEAERRYMSDFSPNVRPIPALKARVWVKQGDLAKALAWARERKLSIEQTPGYLREFEQITFARILLARYQSDHSGGLLYEVMGLLERLLKAAENGGRMASVIEILVLQALAHQMQNDLPAALAPLEHALTLAEPEGYIRIFLDEGSSMRQMLRQVAVRGIMPNYTGKLLLAFDAEQQGMDADAPLSASPNSSSLIEPLSQRELDILRLFKTELSGPEIADELVIALSTVRFHTKNIYSKLNVNSRRAAVQRAVELDLI